MLLQNQKILEASFSKYCEFTVKLDTFAADWPYLRSIPSVL